MNTSTTRHKRFDVDIRVHHIAIDLGRWLNFTRCGSVSTLNILWWERCRYGSKAEWFRRETID